MEYDPNRTAEEDKASQEPALPPATIQSEPTKQPIINMKAEVGTLEVKQAKIYEVQGKEHLTPKPESPKRGMTRAEKLMTVLTALITLATIANVLVFYYESEDTSKQVSALAAKAGEIVGSINTAISNNQIAISRAFDANRLALDAASQQSKAALDATLIQMQKQSAAMRDAAQAATDQVRELQAGVDETSRLASSADEANKISKQAMENQTRPWIDIEGDPDDIKYGIIDGYPRMTFNLKVRNYGQYPATIAGTPHFTLGFLLKPEPRLWTVNGGKDVCSFVDPVPGGPLESIRFPHPVFPNPIPEIIPISVERGIPHQDRVNMFDYLSGCITYKGLAGSFYQTKIIYRVIYTNYMKTTIQTIEREYYDSN